MHFDLFASKIGAKLNFSSNYGHYGDIMVDSKSIKIIFP